MQYSFVESPSETIIKNVPNGRVNLVENPDPHAVIRMQERIALKNKSSSFSDAINGQWEDNLISTLFFSKENIQIIQNGLRKGVYEMSDHKFVIPPQNIDQLKIIMRSIYLQYAEHYDHGITQQIERLNKLVLDYAIPAVHGESVGYLKYCEDQSSIVTPLQYPRHADRRYKQLELKPWF
jgi:hypothetical protein